MATDFVEKLTEEINLLFLSQNVNEQIQPERTKEMVIKAADAALVAATKGQFKNHYLQTKEVAYVVASLMYDQPGFNRGMVNHAPKKK
jgi:uncharacterized protein YqfA (UPF0365 family)